MAIQFPPRGEWATRPTPLEPLSRLGAEWGVDLWVKRDDLTGFAWGGNKIRKLDFLVQAALAENATCLITCGGVQSNHCRATAALAAKLGLRCVLLLRGEAPATPHANYLLDKLFGAEILFLSEEQYYEEMGEVKSILDSQIRSQGGKAYFIPEGGSNGLGCFGYAEAFAEMERQREECALPPFDSVVVAHGSGGTQAGLVLGKLVARAEAPRIVGVNVCYDAKESFRRTKEALWEAIQRFHLPLSFLAEDIEILDGFRGRGYALSTPAEREFLRRVAGAEGLLLDPVYTGKAFRALGEHAAAGKLGKQILFWHTGGAFGNFRDEEEWREALA